MLTLIRRRCRRYLLLLLVVLLLYHGLSLMSHARNKKTIHVHDHAHVYKYAVISKESQANIDVHQENNIDVGALNSPGAESHIHIN